MFVRISAVLITLNEEKNILPALDSVSWADEIVVVDSGSTDKTVAIAKREGARVILNEWKGFSAQKQFAVDAASNDWIFSLDADERVSSELCSEIKKIAHSDSHFDGYFVPRLSVYMGREIRHGGWYPDRQMRFFNRKKGAWSNSVIHESFKLFAGSASSNLDNNIIHFSVENSAHHHRMIGERYAPLAAKQMFDRGRRTSATRIMLAGPAAFIRSYFLKAGFLDGLPGFAIAKFAAHHAFLKHLQLWELQVNKD